MKFAMNGCLILAARGGSNDELRQEIGGDNIVEFLFNTLLLSCKTHILVLQVALVLQFGR